MAKTNYDIPRWKDCAECGAPIEQPSGRGKARKYCSDGCRNQASIKRRLTAPSCEIEGCEKPSRTNSTGLCEMHYYRRYLTGDAGSAEPKQGAQDECVYCGTETPGLKYCSSRCAARFIRGHPKTRECPICGDEYNPIKEVHGRDRLVCSDSCDRIRKNLAVEVRRGQSGERFDAIDPVEVFQRDGYICQDCGKSCYQGAGRLVDRPEIDHIIPISRGGTHTWANVQTLCRSCNARKGNKMPEWVDERQHILAL